MLHANVELFERHLSPDEMLDTSAVAMIHVLIDG